MPYRLLEPGSTFVDIGANSGFFTLLAAKRVGSSGQVLSFEPLPSMVARIEENLILNGYSNVRIYKFALSDQAGFCKFYEGPERNKGISSLRQIDNSSKTLQVETMPLDELPDLPHTVDLIKIDVEGAEQK